MASPILSGPIKWWMEQGPDLVAEGCRFMAISDREPILADDRLTPGGGYGWMYGWRWLDDTGMERPTLPEAVFRALPGCPYSEVVAEIAAGRGIMPRWPTRDEAVKALSEAAIRWAMAGRSKMEVPL